MNPKFSNVSEVVAYRLCIGCGACEPACPAEAIELFDFFEEGIRPTIKDAQSCADCTACLKVCPGIETDFRMGVADEGPFGKQAIENWGPILEIWEGHASDPDIRYKGSSGGALTALANYCLDQEKMYGILHTGQDPDDPSRNRTRLSTTKEAVLQACGSRYSPASICNGLPLVEKSPAPCAVIGKPSEIAALRKSQAQRPALDAKVGVAMTFFCAETPPTSATHSLMEMLGMKKGDALKDLKYRGNGWPGHFAPLYQGESEPREKLTYQESWTYLQSFRPWATHIWPDGGGELADISCGDPWYQQPDGANPGSSLVVVRSSRGQEIVKGAIETGYLELTPAELWKLDYSQANLLKKKGAAWGRIASMKLMGLKAPRFTNSSLASCWNRLPFGEKVRSTLGTIKRILKKTISKPLFLNQNSASRVIKPELD